MGMTDVVFGTRVLVTAVDGFMVATLIWGIVMGRDVKDGARGILGLLAVLFLANAMVLWS